MLTAVCCHCHKNVNTGKGIMYHWTNPNYTILPFLRMQVCINSVASLSCVALPCYFVSTSIYLMDYRLCTATKKVLVI